MRKVFRTSLFAVSAGTLLLLGLLVAAAPLLTVYDPTGVDLLNVLRPPGPGHLMGTDQMGRDVWARLLYGGRVSMLVGLTSVLFSLVAGVLYGAVSGYLGGPVDRLMMRVVDALLCLPGILIMMVLQSLTRPSILNVILVIGFTSWMQTARLVRTELLALKELEFVVAARAAGTPAWKIICSHLVPHAAPTIIVMGTVGVGHAIMSEATLSFLGLGIPPHQPSWGNMLIGGQNQILSGAWWVVLFPGIMIVATVLSVTFLGDMLQDMLAQGQGGRKESGLSPLRKGKMA